SSPRSASSVCLWATCSWLRSPHASSWALRRGAGNVQSVAPGGGSHRRNAVYVRPIRRGSRGAHGVLGLLLLALHVAGVSEKPHGRGAPDPAGDAFGLYLHSAVFAEPEAADHDSLPP